MYLPNGLFKGVAIERRNWPEMGVRKHNENFAFLILRLLDLLAREVCKFLNKKFLTFSIASEFL